MVADLAIKNFQLLAGLKDDGVLGKKSLRLDNNENWRGETFFNTATHELGHILGLSHVNATNQIMSRFQNSSIQAPTAIDIARMQAIWGPSRS